MLQRRCERREQHAVLGVVYVVVAADGRVVGTHAHHQRELILDRIGVFGIYARLGDRPLARERPCGHDRLVGHAEGVVVVVEHAHVRRCAHVERRAQREVVGIHKVERHGILYDVGRIQTEIGVGRVVVVVEDHRQIVLYGVGLVAAECLLGADRYADLHVGVYVAVVYLRTVYGGVGCSAGQHLVAHRVAVVHLSAQTLLVDNLPAPADLRATLGLVQPFVRHVDLVGLGHVDEAVVVVVVAARIHRAVGEDDRRQTLVARDGQCRREVDLGAQLAVEIEVEEQPLVVGGLAVFEVDLSGYGLVACRYRCHALGYLYRVEPHARRVAQTVRGARALHYGAVLVEYLRIGAGQTEHLDLARARYGVAVTDRNRSRVLERLGQIAAGHFAQSGERDLLVAGYAALLGVVAPLARFDHYGVDRHLVVGLHLDREAAGVGRNVDLLRRVS